ncbi:VMA21-like domain-containing protein [Cinnamomum micranthum f. kanehirae]|uniref:Vacuolar ATPase assembly integral membrane protein VMA21 homolog n=1 Tax=Cinnamomum micranthum f. kanehirae TaxID=337451 RepID=A0A443NGA7_9MAGN|nr:VMA21-like domain-containing protein [Cinnamomum micranthum f. kanehirae]
MDGEAGKKKRKENEGIPVMVPVVGVIRRFFLASIFMWMAPIAILYGFNHQIFPGSNQLSSYSQTLLSGFLAVVSVNLVIAVYIIMAMKEPSDNEHKPDPAFLAEAKSSINQSAMEKKDDSVQVHDKDE